MVKIEDVAMAFETNPWVNYKGDLYMGQSGERYVVTNDLEDMDKWGQLVQVVKKEGSPYDDFKTLKLLNAMKVCHIQVDNLNIVLYV